jgi:hypothetical protein
MCGQRKVEQESNKRIKKIKEFSDHESQPMSDLKWNISYSSRRASVGKNLPVG